MEVEELQSNASRFSRANGNGRSGGSNKIGQNGGDQQYHQDDDEDGEPRRGGCSGGLVVGGLISGGIQGSGPHPHRGWHNSSRIVRVSRTSGGKDRHSKVLTSRGLRDRRIRLSVTTAIQFYDIQDRLGYDQPSKAVEWLIKAAADPIAELPSLNNSFPNTPNQPSKEKRRLDFEDVELDGKAFQQEQQHVSLSKSACSSTSETSKGSGLSLSRTEVRVNRVKARESAKERAAKDKEKEKDHSESHQHHRIVSPISQNGSFTELLGGCIGGGGGGRGNTAATTYAGALSAQQQQQPRQWSSTTPTPMEYFNTGLLDARAQHSSGFSGQIQLGSSLSLSSTMTVPAAAYNVVGDNQTELQHFSLAPDNIIPVSSQSGTGNDNNNNLNFTISSSGLAGFNRGTLQSNFPSLWPHIQRTSPTDGSNLPFFLGAPTLLESHHHQFPPGGFDSRFQLCYGNGSRLSDHKGKGKN